MVAPRLDLGLDGRDEWHPGTSLPGFGGWGWQDRFADGTEVVHVNASTTGTAAVDLWVPADLTGLGLTVRSASGNISSWTLLYGTQVLLSGALTPAPAHRVDLSPEHLADLRAALAQRTGLSIQGLAYHALTVEVNGAGQVTFSAASAPAPVAVNVEGSGQDVLVRAANAARAWSSGTLDLDLLAERAGRVQVKVLEATLSTGVQVHRSDMVAGAASPVTPSATWRQFNVTYLHNAAASAVRLDVMSTTQEDAWHLPLDGSPPAHLLNGPPIVELHPQHPVRHVSGLGLGGLDASTEVQVTFRLTSEWEDAEVVDVELRLVDADGTTSMPAVHRWSNGEVGLDDDIVLDQVVFSDHRGPIAEDVTYLVAGTPVNVSINIGWESLADGAEPFAPGDADVQVLVGGSVVHSEVAPASDQYTVSTVAPFTFGNVTWEVRLISTSGLGLGPVWSVNRTFEVDPMAPSVLSVDAERYDHRETAADQRFEIEVMDHVLLPAELEAMVWLEWRDDDNGDRWPDPNEHRAVQLHPPADLSQPTGIYTLFIDDTSGLDGERVGFYVRGSDAAGHALRDGGGPERTEHLVIYQLGPEHSPQLPSGGFALLGGPRSILHPATSYTAYIEMKEGNGLSDLAEVEVHLASNQMSSPMTVAWSPQAGGCSSTTGLVIVHDCSMKTTMGAAGAFSESFTLELTFELAWTTPNLGTLTRAPGVVLVDRAGNRASLTYDEAAWRFSSALEIPSEDVDLHLSQGTMLDDGARLTPGSRFEVSGSVRFAETHDVPSFECGVDLHIAGRTTVATANGGRWSTEMTAPSLGGTLPLTWGVGCLPDGGVDVTDESNAVLWMVVDGTGPTVVDVASPLPGRALNLEVYEIELVVEEEGGLDYTTLGLTWWLVDDGTGEALRTGRVPMRLQSDDETGLRLQVEGTLDLSEIDRTMLRERLTLAVALDGRDLAGNEAEHPVAAGGIPGADAAWSMVWLHPEFGIDATAVTYQHLALRVADSTVVEAAVSNTGTLDGAVIVRFEVVHLDGSRELLREQTLRVGQGAIETIAIDWQPDRTGAQWVEVVLPEGQQASGPVVDVRPEQDARLSERVFGSVNPMLGGVVGLLGLLVAGLFLAVLTRRTTEQGAKESIDWSDFDAVDEEDEDDDEDDEVVSDAPVAPPAEAASANPVEAPSVSVANADSTGWMQGADGVWWYRDPADGSWWYQDEHGENKRLG